MDDAAIFGRTGYSTNWLNLRDGDRVVAFDP